MAKAKQPSDISQLILFPAQDDQWIKKILIGSVMILLSFIPIIPVLFLLGYYSEIIRQIVVEGKSPSLPEWDDLGKFFQDGIKLFGVGFIYMIPSTLLIGVGYLGMFIPLFLVEANVMSEYQALLYLIVGYLAGFGLMGIGTMIAMVTGVLMPVAGIHVVVKDDFSAAFKFRQIWQIFKANWSGFLVAFLILVGASIFLYYGLYFIVATVILCCLYPFILSFMSAYIGVVGVALFGDAYRVGLQNLPTQE